MSEREEEYPFAERIESLLQADDLTDDERGWLEWLVQHNRARPDLAIAPWDPDAPVGPWQIVLRPAGPPPQDSDQPPEGEQPPEPARRLTDEEMEAELDRLIVQRMRDGLSRPMD